MVIEIPEQLKREEFRFVLLGKPSIWLNTKTGESKTIDYKDYDKYCYDKSPWSPLGKSPFEKEWQINGYEYDSEDLRQHINDNEKNYGVIGGYGDLRIIDIDDVELAKEMKEKVNTFTIQTGSGGMHFYTICPYSNNHRFLNKKGELRANNYQVVGPNCTHPNGNKYVVINDSPIKILTEEEMMILINPLIDKKITSIDVDVISENQVIVNQEFIETNILPRMSNLTYSLITEEKTKEELISQGYSSRSERDQKVITTLVLNGFGRYVKSIFDIYPIGDKYREHPNSVSYIEHSIKTARKYSGVVNDNVPRLEMELEDLPENVLRNKVDAYLIEIGKIDSWVSQTYLINVIARKIMISSKDLQKRLEEIKKSNSKSIKYNIKDLFDFEIPKMNFFVKPIIPKKSLIFFGGMFGHFKSTFTTALALYSLFEFKFIDGLKRGEVTPRILIYDQENDISVMAGRIQSILRGNNIDKDMIEKSIQNLHVLNDFDCHNLKRELERAITYDMIILDSYRRFLVGSENDSEVSNRFYIDFIKPLRDMGKTIIIIHHLKKFTKDDLDEDFLMQLFRGTGDIIAQADLAFILFKNEGTRNLEGDKSMFDVNVIRVKNRYGINISKDMSFKVETEELDDIIKSAKFFTSNFRKLAQPKERTKNKVLEILREKGEMDRNALEIIMMKETNTSKYSLVKYLKELIEEGYIIQPSYGKYKIVDEVL